MNRLLQDDARRPSHLALDRFATGELRGEERARVQSWLGSNPDAQKHLEGLGAAKAVTPPLDLAAVRGRARALGAPDPQPVLPAPDPAPPTPDAVPGEVSGPLTASEVAELDLENSATLPFAEPRAAFPTEESDFEIDEAPEPAPARREPAAPQAPPPQTMPGWALVAGGLALIAVLLGGYLQWAPEASPEGPVETTEP